jgi:FkbM family methyltransferase
VKQSVKNLTRRFGLEVSHYRPFTARVVSRLEGVPLVLDVGASRGQYALDLREHGYRGDIVSFEPVTAAFTDLAAAAAADPAWTCHRVAAGAAAGEAEMYVASNLASSSLLTMGDPHKAAAPEVGVTGGERVPVARLDDLVDDDRPCLLKLDVQGFEDRVLDGAPATLARAVLVQCEMSLEELYEGQAQFRPLIDRLDAAGFSLVDLDPFFYDRTDGRVLSIDGLFARAGAGGAG